MLRLILEDGHSCLAKFSSFVWPREVRVSERGIEILKHFEGFSPKAYDDGYGNMTIGYGHLLAHDSDLLHREISIEEAHTLFVSDIRIAAAQVVSCIRVSLEQHQFDALASLCFNIGCRAFQRSSLVQRINEGRKTLAYDCFGMWKKAGGKLVQSIMARRLIETCVFANKGLDHSIDKLPSNQWGLNMPITDENWRYLSNLLRWKVAAIYKDYVAS